MEDIVLLEMHVTVNGDLLEKFVPWPRAKIHQLNMLLLSGRGSEFHDKFNVIRFNYHVSVP